MKAEMVLKSLEKLYEKRKALDKQIGDTEKKFVTEAKAVSKAAAKEKPAKKTVAKRKPSQGKRGRKPKIQL